MPSVLKPDPFSATLLNSVALVVSNEQAEYIKKILDKACSDSRFADKAFIAIMKVLTSGSVKAPAISSLTPNSAEVGDPSFLLHVHGTNFTSGSIIMFNGGEEPTTFVSATELTTAVNMSTVLVPSVVPVNVISAEGVMSDFLNFTFTDGTPVVTQSPTTVTKSVTVTK